MTDDWGECKKKLSMTDGKRNFLSQCEFLSKCVCEMDMNKWMGEGSFHRRTRLVLHQT